MFRRTSFRKATDIVRVHGPFAAAGAVVRLIGIKMARPSTRVVKLDGGRTRILYEHPSQTPTLVAGLSRQVDPEVQWAINRIDQGSVVVEIGAAIGLFAVSAALRNPAVAVAVEPSPENVRTIRQNLAENNVSGRVVVLQAAVVDRPGRFALETRGSKSYLDQVVPLDGESADALETLDMAGLCERFGITTIDVLLIDTAGSERDIIMNAMPWFRSQAVGVGVFLYGIESVDAYAEMGRLGYSVGFVHPKTGVPLFADTVDVQTLQNLRPNSLNRHLVAVRGTGKANS